MQPIRLDKSAFWNGICKRKWDMTDGDIETMKDIAKEVQKSGMLGMTQTQVKVSESNCTKQI